VFGLNTGEPVTTDIGNAVVLGAKTDEESPTLVIKFDNSGKILCLRKEQIRDLHVIARDLSLSVRVQNHVLAAEKVQEKLSTYTFIDFKSHLEKSEISLSESLSTSLKALQKISQTRGISHAKVSMFDILVFNQSSDIDLLEQLCLHSCVLQVFNSFVLMSMSFLDLCESYTVERTSAFWIRKCRDFIFPEPKKKLLRDVIQSTITSTRPSEDPYEDPPDLKKIEINRHKASKAREQGDVKVAFKNSVFMQLFNCLQDLPVEQLRRSYVHKLDDGQERTFKVKFTGEGVQDNGGPYRECFNEVVSELFSQEVAFPLFIPCPNNRENQGQSQDCFVPNPACNDFQYYEFFGKIIGMALRHRIQLNMNLAPIFWKWIVEVPLTLDDLQEYDFHAAKVIQEVSKYVYLADSSLSSSADEDFFESVFDLTFECTLADGITKKELIPGGSRVSLSSLFFLLICLDQTKH
jgi:hypothetical protein